MNIERQERIAARWAQMPRIYRATYNRAVSGRSLRAAVNSFCAECCMWQREEVRLCTSLACPLWPYRPYRGKTKRGSKNTSEKANFDTESANSENKGQG